MKNENINSKKAPTFCRRQKNKNLTFSDFI